MKPIRILHASDLHIAFYKNHNYRSPIDRLEDINFLYDWSWNGIWEKLKTPQTFFISWWKKCSASSYEPEVLDALAEYIYRNAKKKNDSEGNLIEISEEALDAIVLTGDLATTGEKEDILQTRRFLQGKPNPKRPYISTEGDRRGTLAALRIPVISLPGNHDRLIPTRRFAGMVPQFFNPGGEYFDDEVENYRVEPVKDIELESTESEGKTLKVLVLAADCTLRHFEEHEGILGWIAQGKAHDNVLHRLRQKTTDAVKTKKENEILCVIWACHFPPDYPGMKSHSRLINEEKFIEAANEMEVPVTIIAGHTHRQLNYRSPNMKNEAYCCGTTTQYEPMSKYGEKYAEDEKQGNLFQIINITLDAKSERARIKIEDYRYTSIGVFGGGGLNANEMDWVRISS